MKKSTVIVMWSLITAAFMSLFSLAMSSAGIMSKSLQYVGFLIMFIGLFIGMVQFRNKVNGGFASFGELYKVGIIMVLIIAAFSTLYFLVYLQINPGFIDKIREQAQADMINKGLSSDQIQMGMKMTEKFTSPIMMTVFGFIGNIFFGAILGLLAAGISAKAKPFMEEDNNSLPS